MKILSFVRVDFMNLVLSKYIHNNMVLVASINGFFIHEIAFPSLFMIERV